ncbi:class I adenylate-forming enzyme family protein [Nocardia shimofusensis]|uniref:class I adenylate-forming enzyme family protein n=1 Tax=Nocardia shimofusensis TaxID=228596 RepID=UPI000A82BB61|nr:AMP-binding protein [Nocardia shimofusensis]
MLDPLRGRVDDRAALDLDGRALTYRELARAIEEYNRAHSGVRVYDASALSTAEALICVCAAARRGIPVHVENPEVRPARESIPAEALLLVATSGSTGAPRPLARTARSWYDSFPAFSVISGVRATDRVLLTGPLHATMHLFGALHALWSGACVTDDAGTATVVHAVPAVLREVLARAPRLRTAIVAGIALDAGAVAAAGELEIVEYYGSAEVSLVAARRVPEPLRVIDGVHVEVRDGLLYVRSPYTVLGAPDWFPVGDLAELRAGGELVVRGRGDGVVNVGGATVVAEDVERILGGVDGVSAVAVIGAPHEVFGEIVTAVLELDASATLPAVRSRARALLSKEAVPRRWITLPALPRTASGKVARGDLKNMVL